MSEYRDERTVAAEVEAAQPVEASLGIAGTVTSSVCVAGSEIRSGRVVASLSGRPVLGLHSAVPFYRDIGPGTVGADVDALRAQLIRMGFGVPATGAYEADLKAAILKVQTDLALKHRDGVLHQDETLWLPAEEARVKSCNALLGSQYTPGSPFFTIVGSVTSVHVVFSTGQPPAAGARTVTFGNVSAPMNADGTVTDPVLLAEVSSSPDFAELQSSTSPKPLSIKTALSSPLEVAKIPLAGVSGAHRDIACVKSTDGTTLQITIAGSSAGSVLASFQRTVPKEIFLGKAIEEKECP
ncbi:hypothetical protein AB0N65_15810 [Paenarthrobacter sp. NPDC089322]|uniref:hypothetical protein n=1 Tax=Paenarthrobacter sp. NPDC089322 TaxID=3155065 RepID=UPI00344249CC